MNQLPRRQILIGDAIEQLQELPAGQVDCVITSPPYFRLRDYDQPGQIGLEARVDDWVERLRELASEVARMLVPTGTFWLNVADTYSLHARQGAPRKSLLLAPERLVLALAEDGWLVRNVIIWDKPATTPSSVADRLSTTHEVIYLLTRTQRYFFDLDAIRAPHLSKPRQPRPGRRTDARRPAWLGPNSDGDSGLAALRRSGLPGHPLGKNPGDVWRIGVSRYRGAHFATFPEALAERMVQAGVPEARCTACLRPWRRPVRRLGATAVRLALAADCGCEAGTEPGLVLDPFLGAATTALAAETHGRDWLGIELNPDYAELATTRINEHGMKGGADE